MLRGRLVTNSTTRIFFTVLSAAVMHAQSPPRPEFEVASIRASVEPPQGTFSAGGRTDGAQARWTALSLKEYIAAAYGLKPAQVSGPGWLGSQRFDISATLPAGSTPSQIPAMLQRLLEERFQVKMHREKKEVPAYVLEVAKSGVKMQESAANLDAANSPVDAPLNSGGSVSGQGISVTLGRGSSYTFSNNKFEAKRLTMDDLVANLEPFLDRPIENTTDLKGSYDFTLEITPEDYRTMMIQAAVTANVVLPPQVRGLLDGAAPVSLFDAMRRLGITMDARKASLDLFVIDEVRKTPTEN